MSGGLEKRLKAYYDKTNATRANKDFLPEDPTAYYNLPDTKRCAVCQGGDYVVGLTNRLLASGATIQDVYETVKPVVESMGKKISYSSIKTHQTKHLPYMKSALRKIVESNALLYQKDMLKGEGTIITPAAFAEAMLAKGMETLQDDSTVVRPTEALRAAEMLTNLKKELVSEDAKIIAEMREQQNLLIAAIQQNTTQEQQEMILSFIRKNSVEYAQKEIEQDYRNVPNPNHFNPEEADAQVEEDDAEFVDMSGIGESEDGW